MDPLTHLDINSINIKEPMNDPAQKHLGTVTYPETLPLEVVQLPFESADSRVRMYCKRCKSLRELSAGAATTVLALAFPHQSPPPTLALIEPNKSYILADGCPDCPDAEQQIYVLLNAN